MQMKMSMIKVMVMKGMVKMKIDDDEDHGLTTPNARIDRTVVAHRHHEHTKR